MIVDSSAILAILLVEPDAHTYAVAIAKAYVTRLSAANYIEVAARVEALRNPIASRELDAFIKKSLITIEDVTAEQAQIAREAYRDFGRGSGHPAKLNFGDSFSYALAKAYDEPLLYKGKDFSKTDIQSALK